MGIKASFLVFLANIFVVSTGLAEEAFAESAFDYANRFNRECTGATYSSTSEKLGTGNLPDPLQIERLLKDSILDTFGLSDSDPPPSYSSIQSDLSILNVNSGVQCRRFRWILEQEFHIYGLKAWIERAGASSYFLIHKNSEEPQVIQMSTYFTW